MNTVIATPAGASTCGVAETIAAWKSAHEDRFYFPSFEPASLSQRGGDEPALSCFYETPIGLCYANSISLETGRVFRFA